MGFEYENLDSITRQFMMREVELDESNKKLFISSRLNLTGREMYSLVLKETILNGNEELLAKRIYEGNMLNTHELKKTKTGTVQAKVPVNAHIVLAEGEFNRFYIRALCLRVLEGNSEELLVYRARHSDNPRSESQFKIGMKVNPQKLLDDLRESIGVDTALGLPPGPNSGLSVKIKK